MERMHPEDLRAILAGSIAIWTVEGNTSGWLDAKALRAALETQP